MEKESNMCVSYKSFLKSMLVIVMPMALQQLATSLLNILDTLMISTLGDQSIAAVGAANKVFFFLMLIMFGLYSGVGIFIAQYFGSKDYDKIKKIMGVGYIFGLTISLIFTFIAQLIPSQLVGLFSDKPDVISQGVNYLRIVSLSFPIMALSFNLSNASRSIGKVLLPSVTIFVALSVNTILNFLLIEGRFGFPRLEVTGAAVATVTARIIEFIILFTIVYLGRKSILSASIKELLSFNMGNVKKVFSKSFFVILNEGLWSLGIILYFIAYGKLGTEAFTSMTVVDSINGLIWVFNFGVGSAAAIMIGQKLGSNELRIAKEYANLFIKTGVFVAILVIATIFAIRPFIPNIFTNLSEPVVENIKNILVVQSIYSIFIVWSTMFIIGIFRAGGDTLAAMLIDILPVYLVGVPLAFVGVYVFKLGIVYVFALVNTDNIFKVIFSFIRYKSNKWNRNLTH